MSSKDLYDGFEQVSCEICEHDERVSVASRTDMFLGGHDVFHMYECLQCGVIYQYPRPTPAKITDFYPSDYQQYTASVRNENWLARFFRKYGLQKRCKIITKYVPNGRLLDVGCATGDFLSEMRFQTGWQVVGIEPGHTAAAYAHNEEALDVVSGFLNDPPFAKQSFDAITMWDVLEHVYNPREVIRQTVSLLRSGGVLIVNHPNLDSVDRRLFGDLWLGYELPRHLYLFPSDLLRQLMQEIGLTEITRKSVYGSHAATMSSLMFLIEKRFGNGKSVQLIRKILFSKITRFLFMPYFKVIDHRLQGSNITAVFQKTA